LKKKKERQKRERKKEHGGKVDRGADSLGKSVRKETQNKKEDFI